MQLTHAINYFNHVLTHKSDRCYMLCLAVSKWLHVSSTRYQTCHQTILLACQLKVIGVLLQLQHNY